MGLSLAAPAPLSGGHPVPRAVTLFRAAAGGRQRGELVVATAGAIPAAGPEQKAGRVGLAVEEEHAVGLLAGPG